jgi:hypothetical protein
LSLAGVNFVVSYSDASIIVYDTRTGDFFFFGHRAVGIEINGSIKAHSGGDD